MTLLTQSYLREISIVHFKLRQATALFVLFGALLTSQPIYSVYLLLLSEYLENLASPSPISADLQQEKQFRKMSSNIQTSVSLTGLIDIRRIVAFVRPPHAEFGRLRPLEQMPWNSDRQLINWIRQLRFGEPPIREVIQLMAFLIVRPRRGYNRFQPDRDWFEGFTARNPRFLINPSPTGLQGIWWEAIRCLFKRNRLFLQRVELPRTIQLILGRIPNPFRRAQGYRPRRSRRIRRIRNEKREKVLSRQVTRQRTFKRIRKRS